MPTTVLQIRPLNTGTPAAFIRSLLLVIMAGIAGALATAAAESPATAHDGNWPDALEDYARRAAAMREAAMAEGSINYRDVIDAAYGTGGVDAATFAAKARWREAHAAHFEFVTDYSTLLDAATVTSLKAVPDARLQSTLVAQYESLSNTIAISPVAADFAIFHETGHALQRAALKARGTAQSQRSELPEFILMHEALHRAIDPTTLHRLEYLCSQVELEVRLQDLNRFHAVVSGGRPIMGPLDALRALVMLGVPVTYEESRDAFQAAGGMLTPEEFAHCTPANRPEAGRIATLFEDARELRLMRTLSRRVDPACWTRLLAKLIFEAPGHL